MHERSLSELQTHHGEVGVVSGEAQAQLGLHLWGHSPQYTVKYMVVPLIWSLDEITITDFFTLKFPSRHILEFIKILIKTYIKML